MYTVLYCTALYSTVLYLHGVMVQSLRKVTVLLYRETLHIILLDDVQRNTSSLPGASGYYIGNILGE